MDKKYIDAEEFIKTYGHSSNWNIKKIVDDFPAADVRENVRARWINVETEEEAEVAEDGSPIDCECSNCGEYLVGSDELPVVGNFCPNCGADMRGVKQ